MHERSRLEKIEATLLDAAPDAMLIVDINGVVQRVNRQVEVMFGYAKDELIGGPVDRLLPEHCCAVHRQHVATYAAAPRVRRMGTTATPLAGRRKNGEEFPIDVSLSPLKTEEGLLVIAAVRDITERRRLESEILQAQKMDSIGRLAGGIAHDFNNLLTPIVSYAAMLQSRFQKEDPAWEEIEEIRGAANRAADLTRQLLAFGRRQILRSRPLDINVAVVGMKNLLARLIGEDIDLAFNLGSDLWRTMLDPIQVEQVLMNLAANARDAMPAGGKLTIETANTDLDAGYASSHVSVKPGSYVLLAVTDTGSGMDDETRAHIFDPFFTTKKEQGTGLGLASVYGIVKQSGGYIWVYSEPGKGATFKLYFPKTDDKSIPFETTVSPRITTTGTETVLLVEDNAAIRKLAARVLERAGYSVLAAATPGEALEGSGKHRASIHLLICDVILPDMNGRVLCDKLLEARPELRVLFMSGFTQNAVVHRGVLDKGVEFLEKPFVPSALLDRVREILDRPIV